MKLICSLILVFSLTIGMAMQNRTKAAGYAITGYGKPLCPIKNCNYFSDWMYGKNEILACYKHSIDDYTPKDSVLWLPYKKEMEFGY